MTRKVFLSIILLLGAMLPNINAGTSGPSRNISELEYNITGAGIATQGHYLVKVEVSTKNKNLSDINLVKAAINGVLFRGFSNSGFGNSQKPLAGEPSNEVQHADFYKEFFGKTGTASNYGSVMDGTRNVIKSGKLYKVSAIVEVRKDALASYLQEAKIINSLNSIF